MDGFDQLRNGPILPCRNHLAAFLPQLTTTDMFYLVGRSDLVKEGHVTGSSSGCIVAGLHWVVDMFRDLARGMASLSPEQI